MNLKLSDIDEIFEKSRRPEVVPRVPMTEGGVDPLGLRQINLDLMDMAFPGINNVTYHIRPYVLVSWAWWKAGCAASAQGLTEAMASLLTDFVDRLEVSFIWSQMLAGEADVPGKNILRRYLPLETNANFHFSGHKWNRLRNIRRPNTSFMAAVQYGPSIKVDGGLGWLKPHAYGTYVPTSEVVPAIKAFDSIVSRRLPPVLVGLKPPELNSRAMRSAYRYWELSRPTKVEKAIFRQRFYEAGRSAPSSSREGRRYRSLALIIAILDQAKVRLDTQSIRRSLASGILPNRRPVQVPADLEGTTQLWIALQARQLARLALEALLLWIEVAISDGIHDPDMIARKAEQEARATQDGTDARTVGNWLDLIRQQGRNRGWPTAAGTGGKTDVLNLISLIEACQVTTDFSRLPGLALRAIGYVSMIQTALRQAGAGDDILGGSLDRLPISLMGQRLAAHANGPLAELWREIISSWVLGQHVRWSVARNGDSTQRLRLALEDNGWVRLRPKLSGPFRPTGDRLSTALSLAAECDLITQTDDEGGPTYQYR